jgi:hypothetical protein
MLEDAVGGPMRLATIVLYILFLVLSVTVFCVTHANANMLISEPIHPCLATNAPTPTGTPVFLPSANHTLLINEVLLHPGKQSYQCNSNTAYPWIELYNPQNQPVSFVQGSIIYSDQTDSQDLAITPANPIPAHGFYVFFFDKIEKASTLNDATAISLNIRGQVMDTVSLPPLTTDQSYIRMPDGSNQWQITYYPTVGSQNSLAPTQQPTKTSTATKTPATIPSTTVMTQIPYKQATGQASATRQGTGTHVTPYSQIQPSWQALHFPNVSHGSTGLSPSQQTVSIVPSQDKTVNAPQDIPKKVIQSLLICVLFLLCRWSYRLFFQT